MAVNKVCLIKIFLKNTSILSTINFTLYMFKNSHKCQLESYNCIIANNKLKQNNEYLLNPLSNRSLADLPKSE